MITWTRHEYAEYKVALIGEAKEDTANGFHEIKIWEWEDASSKDYYITCLSFAGHGVGAVLESTNPNGHFFNLADAEKVIAAYIEYADEVCRVMREKFGEYLDRNEKASETHE